VDEGCIRFYQRIVNQYVRLSANTIWRVVHLYFLLCKMRYEKQDALAHSLPNSLACINMTTVPARLPALRAMCYFY
jgi:hypothetical protein